MILATIAATVMAGAMASAAGKPIAGCPHGGAWQLVTVASLGFPPEQIAGIQSLDGNGDGRTCIRPAGSSITFRDNNVR
jgi:hypothetical protein